MSEEKKFSFEATGGELFFVGLWIWLAIDSHPAWWLAVAAQVMLFFVNPRWNKEEGWRFRR